MEQLSRDRVNARPVNLRERNLKTINVRTEAPRANRIAQVNDLQNICVADKYVAKLEWHIGDDV